ncbi:hypothetical protein F4782DRAFT_228426 [Xylaria castorea]|nr:hypothetical protein F4782DRAFT_228426 [Xylaria castorea]
MECIKRFFISNKVENKARSKKQISSPVDGSFQRVSPENNFIAAYSPRPSSRHQCSSDSHFGHATISFLPQDRGREETIAWLNTSTSESLVALLTAIDQAAKQVRRGPRTKGTREVQLILNEPSRRTVEKFHRVRKQAEMAVRYGTPGVVVYNFSKSCGWNSASTSRVPSLQLKDHRVNKPAVSFSPINWLVLPNLKPPQITDYSCKDESREWALSSPVSEPGGWRDTEQMDISDLKLDLTQVTLLKGGEKAFALGEEEHEDDEGEYGPYNINDVPSTSSESYATAVKMIPVCSQDIRMVELGTTKQLTRSCGEYPGTSEPLVGRDDHSKEA